MKKKATCRPPNLEHGNQKSDAKLIVMSWGSTLCIELQHGNTMKILDNLLMITVDEVVLRTNIFSRFEIGQNV